MGVSIQTETILEVNGHSFKGSNSVIYILPCFSVGVDSTLLH